MHVVWLYCVGIVLLSYPMVLLVVLSLLLYCVIAAAIVAIVVVVGVTVVAASCVSGVVDVMDGVVVVGVVVG